MRILIYGAGNIGCLYAAKLAQSGQDVVVLPKPALAEVLPILAANERTPSVMFFGNNASGPEPMISLWAENAFSSDCRSRCHTSRWHDTIRHHVPGRAADDDR